MQNKRPPMQNLISSTELTLDGVQRGRKKIESCRQRIYFSRERVSEFYHVKLRNLIFPGEGGSGLEPIYISKPLKLCILFVNWLLTFWSKPIKAPIYHSRHKNWREKKYLDFFFFLLKSSPLLSHFKKLILTLYAFFTLSAGHTCSLWYLWK